MKALLKHQKPQYYLTKYDDFDRLFIRKLINNVAPAGAAANFALGPRQNLFFGTLALAILMHFDGKSHATILKYNPYSYFSSGTGRTNNDYGGPRYDRNALPAENSDVSGVFKYCEADNECYEFIEQNATIFVYSQKMKDVRDKLPFQAMNIPFYPSVDDADRPTRPSSS